MRRRLVIWGIALGAVLMLAAVPAALGATPQQIYADYAEHGQLTQHYSRGDLLRAQRDASMQGYPRVGVQGAITRELGARAATSHGTLPFTGLDLTLLAVGGAVLLGAGIGLRKFGRAKS